MIDLFRKVVKNCHITAVKVLFTVEDITESVKERIRQEKERERVQKVLEESQAAAEAANKAKTDFLFNMSHDIRTPMNAIIGYSELMEKYFGDTERCRDYLEKIKKSSGFLLSLINNVLEMARIEGGKIFLTVRELPSERAGYMELQTIVANTGIGMSKEFLPKIFEEFSREYTSTENKIEGTGLGMPIVKKLVDLMDGTIEVESELGKETTFTVTLMKVSIVSRNR